MATVRLTDIIKNEITADINEKFAKQTKPHYDKAKTIKVKWEELWPTELVPHVRAIMHKMEQRSSIYVSVNNYQFDPDFETHGPVPNDTKGGSSWNRIKASEFFPTYYAIVHPITLEIKRIEDERDAFTKEVADMLEQFTTVNQAIKVWPALEDLVRKDTLDKVRQKAVRMKAEDVALDSQSLNTALLKLKVMS